MIATEEANLINSRDLKVGTVSDLHEMAKAASHMTDSSALFLCNGVISSLYNKFTVSCPEMGAWDSHKSFSVP